MAKQALRVAGPKAAVAHRPAFRTVCGMTLSESDGRIIDGQRSMEVTDGFYAYPTPTDHLIFKEPGKDCDAIAVAPTDNVRGVRYVDGKGWYDTTALIKQRGNLVARQRNAWWLLKCVVRFSSLLFSRLGPRISWAEATHPFEGLDLGPNGEVIVEGLPLLPSDAPVPLRNGWLVSRQGFSVVCVHDEEGVRDRFRYVGSHWERLVRTERANTSAVAKELECITKSGEIKFSGPRGPALGTSADRFVMHLSGGRSIVRTGTLLLVVRSGDVREFALNGSTLYFQFGVRDQWAFYPTGIGNGPQLRSRGEVVPGVEVFADASACIANMLFLSGSPIDIVAPGGIRVQRDAGYRKAMVVTAGIRRTAIVFDAAEWWQGFERAGDLPYHTAGRHNADRSILDYVLARIDSFADDAPGISDVKSVIARLCRLADFFGNNLGLFLFFSVFAFYVIAIAVLVLSWTVLIISIPYGIVFRVFRHIGRAIALSK